MRSILLSTLVLAAVAASGTPASAQPPTRANERYCLEVRDASGLHPLLCRFETMQQCIASKTSPNDGCMLNPWLAFQQRQ